VAVRDGGSLGSIGDICRAYSMSSSAEVCEDRKRCGPLGPSTGLNRSSKCRCPRPESGVGASSYDDMVVLLLRLLSSCKEH
jgi:hypothetical protein